MNPDQPCSIQPWWQLQRSNDCVVATAIHDGHALRPEVQAAMALTEAERLREEDPFTGQAILDPLLAEPRVSGGRVGAEVMVGQVGYARSREDELLRAIVGRPPRCWATSPRARPVPRSR